MKLKAAENMKKLPVEFLTRMKRLLGSEYPAFERSYEQPPFRGLRWNPLKCGRERFEALLDRPLQRAPFSPFTYYVPETMDRLGHSYLHHAGAFYVQEPSAASAVTVLDPRPGERVLDLCAAPGGKSAQIAACLAGTGLLWSNEVIRKRAAILLSNIERMGVRNAVVSSCEVERLCGRLYAFFDKILVDAPCSGEGMFRREGEAAAEWSPEHVQACARRQQEILNHAVQALRPGGRLVYSTCTFSPEENEGVVEAFLGAHPDFELEDCGVHWGRPALVGKARRIYPMDGGEGHFVAALRRVNTAETSPPQGQAAWGQPSQAVREFCREVYRFAGLQPMLKAGEQFYLLPEGVPGLDGLGVLRAGFPVCEEKKGRLEPCHAAFMAAKPEELVQLVPLEPGECAGRFLRGEEIELPPTMKGWCGVTIADMTVGFGKASGGRLKNRYPKGLRNH